MLQRARESEDCYSLRGWEVAERLAGLKGGYDEFTYGAWRKTDQ
jgi:hypothetical protein